MVVCVAILYAIAFLAGLGGIALVVFDWSSNQELVMRWRNANPNANPQGSFAQVLLMNEVVVGLIGTTWRRVLAVSLLLLGVVSEALGNFFGLHV